MPRSLARETSIGILIVLGMLLYGVARYPASLADGGQLSFLPTVGALLSTILTLLCGYRAARPPFVLFGLLAVGVTMIGLYPVQSALRQTERPAE